MKLVGAAGVEPEIGLNVYPFHAPHMEKGTASIYRGDHLLHFGGRTPLDLAGVL